MNVHAYRLTAGDEAEMLVALRCELDRADPARTATREGRAVLRCELMAVMARAVGCDLRDLRPVERRWMDLHASRVINMLADSLIFK